VEYLFKTAGASFFKHVSLNDLDMLIVKMLSLKRFQFCSTTIMIELVTRRHSPGLNGG